MALPFFELLDQVLVELMTPGWRRWWAELPRRGWYGGAHLEVCEEKRLERARAEWRVLNSRLSASSPPWFPSGRDTPLGLRRPRFYHRHHGKL